MRPRYAILSDLHSNLEALTAVMREVERLGVDRIVCLGDIVGFNVNPNECIAGMIDASALCVAGNHDLVAIGRAEPVRFSRRAREAILWTRGRLRPDLERYLGDLPLQREVDGQFVACHASLWDAEDRINSPSQVQRMFTVLAEAWSPLRICCFGHTHAPAAYRRHGETIESLTGSLVDLSRPGQYLLNPGSVGDSRDGDKRASFLVFDAGSLEAKFYRVPYDHRASSQKTRAAGLARSRPFGWLAARLSL